MFAQLPPKSQSGPLYDNLTVDDTQNYQSRYRFRT